MNKAIFPVIAFFLWKITQEEKPEGKDPGQDFDDEGQNVVIIQKENVIDDLSKVPSFCRLSYSEVAYTKNFQLREFRCNDGSKTPVPKQLRGNIQMLMEQLEVIRSYFNRPIMVNSGYRTIAHNNNIGGVANSMHLCAMAADISVNGIHPDEVADTIFYLIRTGKLYNGGVGRYRTFTHYDIGRSRTWDNR